MSSKERTHRHDTSPSGQQAVRPETQSTDIPDPAHAAQQGRMVSRLLTPGDVLQLQRTLGNQAVGQLLRKSPVQIIQRRLNWTASRLANDPRNTGGSFSSYRNILRELRRYESAVETFPFGEDDSKLIIILDDIVKWSEAQLESYQEENRNVVVSELLNEVRVERKRLETLTKLKDLRVDSVSIRNFEEGENEEFDISGDEKSVTGRISFIGVVNLKDGIVYLARLTRRHVRQETPEHYEKETTNSMVGGNRVLPIQDTRSIKSIRIKNELRNSAPDKWTKGPVAKGFEGLSKRDIILPPKIFGTQDNSDIQMPKTTKKYTPWDGSAHSQLHQWTTANLEEINAQEKSAAEKAKTITDQAKAVSGIGFTVIKINQGQAIFKDTSGTLNEATFGTIGIPAKVKLHIMNVISRDLGVKLVEGGRAVPEQAVSSAPPTVSEISSQNGAKTYSSTNVGEGIDQ